MMIGPADLSNTGLKSPTDSVAHICHGVLRHSIPSYNCEYCTGKDLVIELNQYDLGQDYWKSYIKGQNEGSSD